MPTAQIPCSKQAPAVARQRRIYWPAVFAAAIPSLLVVGLMIALIWANGRPSISRAERKTAAAVLSQVADEPAAPLPPAVADLPEPQRRAPESVAVATRIVPASPAKAVESAESPKPAPVIEAEVAATTPSKQTCGTAVNFFNNPPDAVRQAVREKKLLFVLHLSGNLEDDCFT
jgi:hypothetical protein